MALWLKQSTATTIVVGPLVDSVDASKEEGLTITQTEVLLWKQGGTGFSAKNEATAATHRSYGMYTVPLDATDTNTLGQFVVGVWESGILVARHDFMIVPANVWDSMFGADYLFTDVKELDSNATSAANLQKSSFAILAASVTNSGHTPTTTTFKGTGFTESTDDHFIGRVVVFTNGPLKWQGSVITDYTGSTQVFTVNAFTEAPTTADTFVIV